jgi:hypothetical protein
MNYVRRKSSGGATFIMVEQSAEPRVAGNKFSWFERVDAVRPRTG